VFGFGLVFLGVGLFGSLWFLDTLDFGVFVFDDLNFEVLLFWVLLVWVC